MITFQLIDGTYLRNKLSRIGITLSVLFRQRPKTVTVFNLDAGIILLLNGGCLNLRGLGILSEEKNGDSYCDQKNADDDG